MYNGLLHLHSLMRWVIIILLLVGIYKHFKGMSGARAYTGSDRKVDLFLMISAHITLLIGLYQWFAGSLGLQNLQNKGFGEVMKNAPERFFAVEHLVGMVLSIVFITIGRAKGKPANAAGAEHKVALGWYIAALVLIFLLVPWPFREGIARAWFPGM